MSEQIKFDVSEGAYDNDCLLLNDDHSFVETTVKCDNTEDYLKALNDVRDVAEKLGIENTRQYLIPYLTHLIVNDKITQLKDIAEILGDFECYVGGSKYVHILLLPLEELAGAKQNDVQIAAIKSLQALADIMEVSDLETYFIPLIASMTMNNKCAKRWSVCRLFTTVYMRVSPKHQGDIIDYHCFLSFDSFSSVRQDAAKCLVDLCEVVNFSTFDSKIIPRLEQFSFDQNEHIRTLALTTAISISNKFDVSYIKQIILPMILHFINDISWKIRLILLKNIAKLLTIDRSCLNLTEIILQILIVLTKDKQLEVRLQSIHILYDCTVVLFQNLTDLKAILLVTEFLIPALHNLSQDSEVTCKLEVPAVLAKFNKLIPDKLIKDYFVNFVKQLLNDTNVDVVFNVIKYMKDILGPQYSNLIVLPEYRLICCLKAFIVNDSWEIRKIGAIYLGILAIQKGIQFFEEYLEQSFLILLTDTKSTVQETTMDVFILLVTEFGMDWAQTYIVPYLINLSYSTNTYNKMAFLSFAKVCATMMCTKFRALNVNIRESEVK
ncbi:Armadillo-type fold,Armadillo-like helical [Cinara cedri]|uniref:Armadillo-type fold,Armadillo-like helical n=1 Tax=Cinara cedri TaxID=506608 RepID=A0A5E4N1P1_9HEMI|nr:Armadillo-type fold,Armadillo-like helical [Cinara cedri]